MISDMLTTLEIFGLIVLFVMSVAACGLAVMTWEAYQANKRRERDFREVSKRG